MSYGFVYMTTNLINGKKYIGQKKYGRNCDSYLGSGRVLKQAIEKYGKENFKREILEECDTKVELDKAEKNWISFYNASNDEMFYNIALGGDGNTGLIGERNPYYNKGHLLEGEKNPFHGRKHSEESKKKMSDSLKGKPKDKLRGRTFSEEHKRKLSLANNFKGENHPLFGKKHSADSLSKMSESHRRTAKRGKENHKSRSVVCITTGEVFETMKDGAKKYHINKSENIGLVCRGLRKSCGKDIEGNPLKWEYYDEYISKQSAE